MTHTPPITAICELSHGATVTLQWQPWQHGLRNCADELENAQAELDWVLSEMGQPDDDAADDYAAKMAIWRDLDAINGRLWEVRRRLDAVGLPLLMPHEGED